MMMNKRTIDLTLCLYSGEDVICNLDCNKCNDKDKLLAIKNFKEKYKYVKGRILLIKKYTKN